MRGAAHRHTLAANGRLWREIKIDVGSRSLTTQTDLSCATTFFAYVGFWFLFEMCYWFG